MTRSCTFLERLPRSFLLILVAIPLLAGCGGDEGQKIANNAPFVQFTGGPTRLEENDGYYSIEARWMGWDFDGELDYFEYALDPNPDPLDPIFTLEEINYPERTLGAPIRVDRGPEDATDTLHYGKTVDGVLYTYSWIQTREFAQILNLSTLIADGDTALVLQNDDFQYIGQHTLFLRGFDNDGAISVVDYLSTELTRPEDGFVVLNLVPETKILSPVTTSGTVNGSNQFTVHWEGYDPDTRDPEKLPESYLWKLIEIPVEWEAGFVNPNVIMYRREEFKDIPWVSIGGDTTKVTVILEGGKKYLFALRAVDEAGATEAHLSFSRGSERGGNTLLIQVNNSARPLLTVFEKTLGTLAARGIRTRDYEIPLGTCLRFTWVADAADYGGQIAVTNYGLDIKDLDDHSPGSGWNGWQEYDQDIVDRDGPYEIFEPLCFNKPGTHTFYVKARDLSGASSIVAYVLDVVEFNFEYPVLYVDDWSNFSGTHTDEFQEKFWLDVFVNSGRFPDEVLTPAIAKHDAWGVTELSLFGTAIPLDVMGSYRLLFWELRSGAYRQSAFSQSGPLKLHIGAFLRVGGQVMYNGIQTIAHALGDGSGNLAVGYPFDLSQEVRRDVDSFPYAFLNIFSSSVGNAIRNGSSVNDSNRETLHHVEPIASQTNLPRMSIDPEKTNLGFHNGTNWDFLQDAISEPSWFTGTIDSLYTGHTVGTHLNDRRSSLDGRVGALRVSYDPDDNSANAQGRFAWFGFPLFYFHQDELQDMVNTMFDWFLEESPYEPGN